MTIDQREYLPLKDLQETHPFSHLHPLFPAVYQECIEGIAKTNEHVVASLARQNLPKCHPEVFEGDATLFHAWKKSFNAMIHDANLNPNQEMAWQSLTGEIKQSCKISQTCAWM